MTQQLITADSSAFTQEQQRLITDVLCKGASPVEVEFCMNVAKRCGLDPFRRQIHFTKRYDGTLQREVLTPIVGIDGLRAIAARSGQYAGNDEPKFEVDERGLPIKATVTVYRLVQGHRVGFTASVWYSESVQMKGKYEGYGQNKKKVGEEPNSMWAKRPFGQLGKCAEGAALRKAFPEDASGVYIEDEIGHEEEEAPKAPAERTVFADGSSGEAEAPAPTRKRAVDAATEVLPPSEVKHWSELLPDAWREVKTPSGGKLGDLRSADAERKTLLAETKDGVLRHALDASIYAEMLVRIDGKGGNVSEFEQFLYDESKITDDEKLLAVAGERLPGFLVLAKSWKR